MKTSTRHQQRDRWVGSASERGYDYEWTRLRKHKITRQPLCEPCERLGKIVVADIVHHIIPIAQRPDLRLKLDNLMSICRSCHEIVHKTVNTAAS